MLSAHFAPALAAKAFRPTISLPIGMALCMLPDLLHALLTLVGIEKLSIEERYSHSLAVVLALAILVFVIAALAGAAPADSALYAAFVTSHFIFDLVNRRRMLVTPWGGRIPGLGLHERGFAGARWISFVLELTLVVGSAAIYGSSVFDGSAHSLIVPGLLLGGMLLGELWYFKIYAAAIALGDTRKRNKIGRLSTVDGRRKTQD